MAQQREIIDFPLKFRWIMPFGLQNVLTLKQAL
jgi:hypothetical protein